MTFVSENTGTTAVRSSENWTKLRR